MRNLTSIPTEPGKSSAAWIKKRSRIRVLVNWFLLQCGEIIPFTQKKQFFYRLMGVKIGKNVQIMPNVFFDIFFPEMITIEDNVVIGIGCFIACHEFNPTEFRYGPILFKKNSLLGARSFVLPGIIIGENSLVGAQSVVHKDVPDNVIAFGSPLQFKPIQPKQQTQKTSDVQQSAPGLNQTPAQVEKDIQDNLNSRAEISSPEKVQELQ